LYLILPLLFFDKIIEKKKEIPTYTTDAALVQLAFIGQSRQVSKLRYRIFLTNIFFQALQKEDILVPVFTRDIGYAIYL